MERLAAVTSMVSIPATVTGPPPEESPARRPPPTAFTMTLATSGFANGLLFEFWRLLWLLHPVGEHLQVGKIKWVNLAHWFVVGSACLDRWESKWFA